MMMQNVIFLLNLILTCVTATYVMSSDSELRLAREAYRSSGDSSVYGLISEWVTTNCTDFSDLFSDDPTFNGDIGNWDTSNVVSLLSTFRNCTSFNQPLSWDTGSVTDMSYTFADCYSFDSVITFNTRSVESFFFMFYNALNFNRPLNFDTSKATTMAYMFQNAKAYDQRTSFDTSNVERMTQMFFEAQSFNNGGFPLLFNTSKVVSMRNMFLGASSFRQDIRSFDVSAVVPGEEHNFQPNYSLSLWVKIDLKGTHRLQILDSLLSNSGRSEAPIGQRRSCDGVSFDFTDEENEMNVGVFESAFNNTMSSALSVNVLVEYNTALSVVPFFECFVRNSTGFVDSEWVRLSLRISVADDIATNADLTAIGTSITNSLSSSGFANAFITELARLNFSLSVEEASVASVSPLSIGTPAPAFRVVQSSGEIKADSLVIDVSAETERNGALHCFIDEVGEFHEVFLNDRPPLPMPSYEYIRNFGLSASIRTPIPFTLEEYDDEIRFKFTGLKPAYYYIITCFTEAAAVNSAATSSAVVVSSLIQYQARTLFGTAFFSDDTCSRNTTRSSIELRITPRPNFVPSTVGSAYTFAQKSTLPPPSTATVKANGKSTFFDGSVVFDQSMADLSYLFPDDAIMLPSWRICFRSEFVADNTLAVVLDGLDPLTEYSIYSFAESADYTMSDGFMHWLFDAAPVIIKTGCCGFVSLGSDFSNAALYSNAGGSNLINFQSVFISQPPTASITVTIGISLYAKSSDGSACTTSPGANVTVNSIASSSAAFTSTDVSPLALSLPFAIEFPSAGCAIYNISFSGASQDEYDSVSRLETLEVFAPDDIPPPPVSPSILSVRFGNAGIFLEITFSSNTDRGIKGGITTPNEFKCDLMFLVVTATSTATCKFTTASTLQMTLTSAANATIGDSVQLLASKIYASCDDDVFDCDSAVASPVQDVLILAPATPLAPIPLITGPSSIASCSDITLSSSTSTGSGGRGWSASSWTVVASASSDADGDLQAFILTKNAAGIYSNTLTVSNALLTQGISYSFQLTLRNFLNSERTSQSFAVSVATQSIPSISIDGTALRAVNRAAALSLFANGIASVCPGEPAKLIPIANYVWSVTSTAPSLPVSTSIDNRFFRLNSFVLVPGRIYTFTVTVTDSAAIPLSNSASVTITVNEAAVIASISGGNRGVSKSETSAALSAASTYDPDYPALRGSAGGFTFRWTCIELSPRLGPCNQFSNLVPTTETLPFTPAILDSFLNTMREVRMRFTVEATHSTGRTSTAATVITIQDSSPPIVSIQPLLDAKVNPSGKINLFGRVKQNADSPISATWTCDELGISLAAVALTQIEKVIPPGSSASTVDYGLVISENTLKGDVSYTFRLSAVYTLSTLTAEGVGFAEITVRANSPPSNGIVVIENEATGLNSGESLSTRFTISGLNWVDDPNDFPLTYSFYYVKGEVEEGYRGGSGEQLLQFESLSPSKANVFLPQGEGSEGIITIIVRVGDNFGAKALATTLALVTAPNLNLNEVGELTKELTADSLARGDSSSVFQILASSVGFLNSVNCSSIAAGFCRGLIREGCSLSEEAQTCGLCLEGYAPSNSRDAGAANTQCFVQQDSCFDGIQNGAEKDIDCGGGCGFCAAGKKCSDNEDCVFGECTNSICTAPTKSCKNDCNGRGRCEALDYNSVLMNSADCKEGVACDVFCACEDGFFGESCGKGADEQLEAETLRQFLLESVLAVGELQFISADTLNQQSGAVFNILQAHDELNRATLDLAASLLTSIARDSRGLPDFSIGTAVFLGEGLSQLMIVTNDTKPSEFGNFSSAIDDLGAAQLDILFVDEASLELITENLKMASVKSSSSLMSNRSFTPPVTDDDISSGRSSPVMVMPSSGLSAYYDESCDVGVSVTEFGSHRRRDISAVETTVMRIGVGCYKLVEGEDGGNAVSRRMEYSGYNGKGRALANEEETKVLIVLQNTVIGAGDDDNEEEDGGTFSPAITVSCEWDEFTEVTTTCPDGADIITVCAGIEKKETITCGGTIRTKTCAFGSPSTEWNAGSCVVVESNANNITCSCDMSVIFDSEANSERRRRRLDGIDEIDEESTDENNVDFVGLFVGLSRNIKSNFELTLTLSPAVIATNGLIFVVMSSILILSFGCCIRGNRKDTEDQDRKRKEMIKKVTVDDFFDRLTSLSSPTFVVYIDSFWINIKSQFTQRHLAINAVFHHSFIMSRPQRIALITCTVLGMLFTESVLYDLSFPDYAPKCDTNTLKVSCEDPASYLDTTVNRCMWTSESQSCSFIEPEITVYTTVTIAIIACIFTSPLFFVLLLIFDSSIFPPTRDGAAVGEEDEEGEERSFSHSLKDTGFVAVGIGSKARPPPPAGSSASVIGGKRFDGSFSVIGTSNLNLTADETVQRNEDELKSIASAKETLTKKGWFAYFTKESDLSARVDREVEIVMVAALTRKFELASTIKLLQCRFDNGDTMSLPKLQSAMKSLDRYEREWKLKKGGCYCFVKQGFEGMVREKIYEDFKLADEIEKEFATLNREMKEVRLLEYSRMMNLSPVEKRIYFRNRLITPTTSYPPIALLRKTIAVTAIAAYCVITAFYITLFGVSHGAVTTNGWLLSFFLGGSLDMLVCTPLKIFFFNIYLPTLISRGLTSIEDSGNDARNDSGDDDLRDADADADADADSDRFSHISFTSSNATVHVAMKHPELDAAVLILSRLRRDENKSKSKSNLLAEDVESYGYDMGDYDESNEDEDVCENGGRSRSRIIASTKNKNKNKTKDTTTKSTRLGLTLLTFFILLPDPIQDAICNILIPSLFAGVVFGNYELYRLKNWSLLITNVCVISVIVGVFLGYNKCRKRMETKMTRKEKEVEEGGGDGECISVKG